MNNSSRSILIGILLSCLPVIYLIGLQILAGRSLSVLNLLQYLAFIFVTLVIATNVRSPKSGIPLAIIILINAIVYRFTQSTYLAWSLLVLFFSFLVWAAGRLSHSQKAVVKLLIYGVLSLLAGLLPALVMQLETRFSEEEFIAMLQVAALMILWVLLAMCRILWRHWNQKTDENLIKLTLIPISAVSSLFIIGLAILVVKAYQQSFYPHEAPTFEGISQEKPFVCGKSNNVPTVNYTGEQVFVDILSLVEANPQKQAPEYGMLALGLNNLDWAQQFQESILSEASQDKFTEPANSVKSSQYEAALRLYYYARIRETFPELFSPQEQDEVDQWFAKINRRAQTIEWVDWLYAIAFNKTPQGPYENQEIGAGLLALLELEELSDPTLSNRNRAYLEDNQRGWEMRFRNTDDAAVYQPIWINNAYFQSLYMQELNPANLELSFIWLLLQTIPDGAPLRYNRFGAADFATAAFEGAGLTGNEIAIWIAGRAVEYLKSRGEYLYARPGVESPLDFASFPPSWGSCLIFGDSGLPNQKGPLAPDKFVFRDGWEKDSTYLLANLRFTGWHRYKATNTVSMIYKNHPIVDEATTGPTFWWLPVGRSLFRDKRIPRENLNGLTIEKTGISGVTYALTNVGGPWAQDPPYYASVDHFDPHPEKSISQSRLSDWHGWEHIRQIIFSPEGPIVIFDEANGLKNQKAAINWQLPNQPSGENGRYRLDYADQPAEIILLPLDISDGEIGIREQSDQINNYQAYYQVYKSGKISLLTVFLFDEWVGAEVNLDTTKSPPLLVITNRENQFNQPIQLFK